MSECARLADQIRRAFHGDAWHGDPLLKILHDVTAKQAAAHPIKGAHSIWELVLHITAWDDAIIRRTRGKAYTFEGEKNFPTIRDTSPAAWKKALANLKATHADLVKEVEAFPDSRLFEQVPGKKAKYHTHFYSFSGIVQHELYHAGQIALLKKFR
ncbi:MAG TPA: DinB family protein [Terriglobales bacterium]